MPDSLFHPTFKYLGTEADFSNSPLIHHALPISPISRQNTGWEEEGLTGGLLPFTLMALKLQLLMLLFSSLKACWFSTVILVWRTDDF